MTAIKAVKTKLLVVLFALVSFISKAQLAAKFTATPISGCSPLLVSFTDQSTGNDPTKNRWDLGNGTISFLPNPSVTYFNPNTYTVRLIVSDGVKFDTLVKTQYITVFALPNINFSGTPLTGCFPLPVNFTDASTPGSGTLTNWQWDFGDGNISNVKDAPHVYKASGNYNVTLKATNSNGCSNVLSKPQYVKISTGVTANFTNSLPNTCNPPAIINFQSTSTATGVLSYQWNFGDGGSSTSADPSHTYNSSGSYPVTLIVTSSGGCTDTIKKNNLINLTTVNAAFTSANNACLGTAINFTNTSSPAPLSTQWYFGDGTTSNNINATHSYASTGTYQVKMIANFGGCIDSALKTIVVNPVPVADFSNPISIACKGPLNVPFTNLSTGANSYLWNFGDGNSSTQPNPSNNYLFEGGYTVSLTATNSFGCNSTVSKPGSVTIKAPKAVINGLPHFGCAPYTHNFSSTVTAVDAVVGYEWDFGDGTTSTFSTPQHTYNTAGSYNIKLVVTTSGGCTDTVFVPNGIVVGTKPAANFVANPRDVCAKFPINFQDLSTGSVTNWLWDFGDGGSSTDQNPSHKYQDTGYFNVQLIVWSDGCPDTIRFLNYVHITPPIAKFNSAFICGKYKERTFTDASIGADEWLWDFGDGTTSTDQNPSHTYADTGYYKVTLTVKNYKTGCDDFSEQVLELINEKAKFSFSDSVICKYNSITFKALDNTAAKINSYNWDFGDGFTGSGATATHQYNTAGTYSVQLVITDIQGCKDTLIKPFKIVVNGPTANFAANIPNSCSQSAVSFNDYSFSDGRNPIKKWVWNYGDGIIDTLLSGPFVHSYAAPGNYNVSLLLIDSIGCIDSIAKASAMTISKPVANFTAIDSLSCPNTPVQFINNSTGPGLTFIWNFGDGTTSTAASPSHTYAAKDSAYTIKLLVFDQYGCSDSISKSNFVSIKIPVANFTVTDSISSCPPLLVAFTNTSKNYKNVNWIFGDGTSTTISDTTLSHYYTNPGLFIAKLEIVGQGGCTASAQKTISIRGPVGVFSYGPADGCQPLKVNFKANTKDRLSFVWDYNDGSTLATKDSLPSHTYTIPGIYLPKMILIDSNGCKVPITGKDTIKVNGIKANFNFVNKTLCDSGIVKFTDSSFSNDLITKYNWDFGDGKKSTQKNPSHFYTNSGNFTTSLIVTTQSGCADTVKALTPLKIVISPVINVTNTGNGCIPLTVTFNSQLLSVDTAIVKWKWDFANGQTDTLQSPLPQVYNNKGVYPVKLIATNGSGCADTSITNINAYRGPAIDAGVDTVICRKKSILMNASGATFYSWSPSKGLSCNNCATPLASPDSSTIYIVTGKSAEGCVDIDTVVLQVKQPFKINTSRGDTLCQGKSTRLYVLGGNFYNWTPSTGLSSATSQSPVATPLVTTNYRVIAQDDKGCFKDTGFVPVKVFPLPVVDAGNDTTINVGQRVDLTPQISSDVTSVTWSPTGGIARNIYPAITVQPKETTEYTVEVKNNGGCKAKDKVTIFVICNGANIYIPNTFSPNGDGTNDIFYPRGSGLFSIKTFRIFSRWGEVVYEKNNFSSNDANAGWDGKYKGKTLTPDVFVYTMDIICDNSSILVLKGNIALIQ
jgi:gliding motility-associated-like protein